MRAQEYSRVEYAGFEFRTEASQADVTFDNSKVRQPEIGARRALMQKYGSIQRIYTHQAWEDGPQICVLEVNWYTNRGVSNISGNPLVQMEDGAAEAEDRSIMIMSAAMLLNTYTTNFLFVGYA